MIAVRTQVHPTRGTRARVALCVMTHQGATGAARAPLAALAHDTAPAVAGAGFADDEKVCTNICLEGDIDDGNDHALVYNYTVFI